MLTGMKHLLSIAQKRGCAIPAFNVYNGETAMGIIRAAEESNACVICSVQPSVMSPGCAVHRTAIVKPHNVRQLNSVFIWIMAAAMKP